MKKLLFHALLLPFGLQAQDYFQQRVEYIIHVRLDDTAHMLHGEETFTYTNNAPASLDTVWMHLWPNAYRDRKTALNKQMVSNGDVGLHFATEEERGYIDSLDFSSRDRSLDWGYHAVHADVAWIKLHEPLASGTSLTIHTPFRVKIPSGKFSRLGHTGQAYYITQWYPKPAVFDNEGWHAMPYLTLGEFYSEFGRFDVTITLPANYVVGATGTLQDNPDEVAFMLERASLPLVDDRSKEANAFAPSNSEYKSLRFVQDDVHDFAWFADKRFQVRKSSVRLPRSGRDVATWVLFTPRNGALWEEAVDHVNESVRLYSEWVGDYPYEACTAVDGTISAGGGMEYPMITIIGNMDSPMSLDNVIAHEVGHNWFYGILGNNERDHAWMDEGVNSFVELRYMRTRYPNGGLSIDAPLLGKLTEGTTDAHRLQSELGYRLNARRNLDQPISTNSAQFTEINYGTMVYMKTALVFDHLFAYLGEELFDRCMHAYFEEWKFKHPRPEDMRRVFERESGKELTWVFGEMLEDDRKLDASARVLKGSNLTIQSKGLRYAAPVPVTGWTGNDSLGTVWIEPDTIRFDGGSDPGRDVTIDGHPSKTKWIRTETLPWPNADRIRIDAGNRTLDIDRRNNTVRARGPFKQYTKPQLKFLLGLEKDDRRSMYWAPLVAWNGHDGAQLGVALYNTTFPSQRTEWVLAPLYGLGSERFGGAGRIEHHFDRMKSHLFQNVHLGLNVRSASTFHDNEELAWFTKLSPRIDLDLRSDPLTRPWRHRISVHGSWIGQESRSSPPDAPSATSASENTYVELVYSAVNRSALAPTSVTPVITWNDDFLRASLDLEQAFVYNKKKDQLRLRLFMGKFISTNDPGLTDPVQAWALTWGPEDMLFEQAYLERGATSGFSGQQLSKQQGAFKTPFAQGGSDDWIASLNAEIDLPLGIPLSLFTSAGYVPITSSITQGGTTTISTSAGGYYEAGIGIQLIRDVLEVWVPLFVSERITKEEEALDRGIGDRIRFVFALERLDPTRALRSVGP